MKYWYTEKKYLRNISICEDNTNVQSISHSQGEFLNLIFYLDLPKREEVEDLSDYSSYLVIAKSNADVLLTS